MREAPSTRYLALLAWYRALLTWYFDLLTWYFARRTWYSDLLAWYFDFRRWKLPFPGKSPCYLRRTTYCHSEKSAHHRRNSSRQNRAAYLYFRSSAKQH